MDNQGQEIPDVSSSLMPVPDYPPMPHGYPAQPATGYPPQPPAQGYNPPAQHPGGIVQQQPMTYQPQMPPPVGMYPSHHITNTNTTVVVQQQAPTLFVQGPQEWSTSMCDCFSDFPICLVGCFCPICLPPYVSVKANECFYVGWLCPIALRAVIRERYNIKGDITGDCCSLYCDYPLTFCQMARELRIRSGS